jgi:hypothetical protein
MLHSLSPDFENGITMSICSVLGALLRMQGHDRHCMILSFVNINKQSRIWVTSKIGRPFLYNYRER